MGMKNKFPGSCKSCLNWQYSHCSLPPFTWQPKLRRSLRSREVKAVRKPFSKYKTNIGVVWRQLMCLVVVQILRASPIVGTIIVAHPADTFHDQIPGERTKHSLQRRPSCCRGAPETSQLLLDTLALENKRFSLLYNTMHKSRPLREWTHSPSTSNKSRVPVERKKKTTYYLFEIIVWWSKDSEYRAITWKLTLNYWSGSDTIARVNWKSLPPSSCAHSGTR